MFDIFGEEVGIEKEVFYFDVLYWVMVEIFFEVGEEVLVEWYFEKLVVDGFVVFEDVRMLGVFVRYYVVVGDWEVVRVIFERMKVEEDDLEGMKNYS